MTSLTWSGCALAYVGKGAGGAGASSKGAISRTYQATSCQAPQVNPACGCTPMSANPNALMGVLACGVGGGHHAVDRLYARKAQKLEECGVQATSRATALRGGCKVDGKLGVPLEGDALAQLMGVGEPDDASAFLGDEAGVLLADAHDALAIRLARGNFFLEGHGRADEGGVHRADAVRVIGRGQADVQLRACRRAGGRGSLGVCRRVASCAQLRAHRRVSR